jgi:hypothetical protein
MSAAKVPGRLLAWVTLIVALGASVAANVASAPAGWGPRLAAGAAPAWTALAAGLIERVPLRAARAWQRRVAWFGLSAVALAAFTTSFEHQRALMLRYGNTPLSAVLLPIAVDGLIVLSSVCMSVIADATCRQLVDNAGAVTTVVDTVTTPPATSATRVRQAVAKKPTASPVEIAAAVGLSERTVQRHLRRYGDDSTHLNGSAVTTP